MKRIFIAALFACSIVLPAVAGEMYETEDEAQSHCPSAAVMWLDTANDTTYQKGDSGYGNTREGAYVCPEGSEHAPGAQPE